jgi:hypothetical protein
MRAWSASAPYPEFPSVPVVHAALVRLYLILTTLAPHQISYTGESDSQLTKGLAALLVRGLSLSISLPPPPPPPPFLSLSLKPRPESGLDCLI